MVVRVRIVSNNSINAQEISQRFHPILTLIFNRHFTVSITDIFATPEETFNTRNLIKVYTVFPCMNNRLLRRVFQCHSSSPIDIGLPILIWRLSKLTGMMLLWKLRGVRLYELWNRCVVRFLQILSLRYRRRVMLCQEKLIQAAQEIRTSSFWILCFKGQDPADWFLKHHRLPPMNCRHFKYQKVTAYGDRGLCNHH